MVCLGFEVGRLKRTPSAMTPAYAAAATPASFTSSIRKRFKTSHFVRVLF